MLWIPVVKVPIVIMPVAGAHELVLSAPASSCTSVLRTVLIPAPAKVSLPKSMVCPVSAAALVWITIILMSPDTPTFLNVSTIAVIFIASYLIPYICELEDSKVITSAKYSFNRYGYESCSLYFSS